MVGIILEQLRQGLQIPMTESAQHRAAQYSWERQTYRDLEIPLRMVAARLWTDRLILEFDLRNVTLFYVRGTQPGGVLGEASIGYRPWDDDRICRIHLYAPYHLRTLGHEITHAIRWMRPLLKIRSGV